MANENVVSNYALVGLQGQLNGVRSELFSTNNNLQGIATLIQSDSNRDQQRLIDEKEQQRELLEKKVRIGQEDELEKKISSSLIQPVSKLEKSISSTFSNITKALSTLFVGVLAPKLLNGLKGSIDLGLKTISGIQNLLKNAFTFIGDTLSSIKNGFTVVIKSIGGIISKISDGIISLTKTPLKSIADAFKSTIGKNAGVPGAATAATSAAAATAVGVGAASKPSTTNFSGLTSKAFGLATRLFSGGAAVSSGLQGDPVGAGIYGSAALFPNLLTGTAALGYSLFGDNIKNYVSDTLGSLKNFDIKNTFNIKSAPNFGINFESLSNMIDMKSMPDFGIDFNAPAKEVEGKIEPVKTSSKLESIQVVPFRGENNPPSNLNQIPEPNPDIVYLQTGNNNQQTSSSATAETPTLTDVPLISSSNPDNFYSLYAQINYNVVT